MTDREFEIRIIASRMLSWATGAAAAWALLGVFLWHNPDVAFISLTADVVIVWCYSNNNQLLMIKVVEDELARLRRERAAR